MVLSVGLNAARAGLQVSADQLALVSRNVARAGDPLASRKVAQSVTDASGYVRIREINRAGASGLVDALLTASSSSSGEKVRSDALTGLASSLVDPDLGLSPSDMLGKLESSLRLAAANPADQSSARAAVQAGKDVAATINRGSAEATAARRDADTGMAQSVDRLNELLARFEVVNRDIVTKSGLKDITDQLDARDALLQGIAQEIGVRVVPRANNDVAIYTDSGITLFETTARTVTFAPTSNLASGQSGNAVYIDGVPATGTGPMAVTSGRIAGYSSVRDDIAVTVQAQYDELARSLVDAFAETDQTSSALPRMPGLFTFAGATGVPAQGVRAVGLAASLQVAAAADPAQGGSPLLIRDGGINGAAYVYNIGNQSGYAGRLTALVDNMSTSQQIAPDARVNATASPLALADATAGWLHEQRRTSSAELEFRNTIYSRATEAQSQSAGVNLDQELAHMLELERSFQANSRLISVLDEMMQTILQDIR